MDIRKFTQPRRRRQRERQKSDGFRQGLDKQNNSFARALRFFAHSSADVVARLLKRKTAQGPFQTSRYCRAELHS